MSAAFGVLASLVSAGAQASAARAQAQQQYQVAQYNRQLALNQSAYARQKAQVEERNLRIRQMKQLGTMRANYGASGVDIDSGSPLDVLEESAAFAELDALNVRHAGEVEATGYENTARLEDFRGGAALSEGKRVARTALLLGAFQAGSRFGLERTG